MRERSRKRHEDLMHFRGALKHRLRCLQATLKERLIASPSAPLLRRLILNRSKDEGDYLLLSRVHDQMLVQPDHLAESHQSFAVIKQCSPQQLSQTLHQLRLSWSTHLRVILDPTDSLAAERCALLLDSLTQTHQDLRFLERWGTTKLESQVSSLSQALDNAERWSERNALLGPLFERLSLFLQIAMEAFDASPEMTLMSDGIVVTCILSGRGKFLSAEGLNQWTQPLTHLPVHSLMVHRQSPVVGQIACTLPLREMRGMKILALLLSDSSAKVA